MCEECAAGAVTLGEIVPGITLIRATYDSPHMKSGDLALSDGQDPYYSFSEDPMADPMDGMSDAEAEELPDKDPRWDPWFEWSARVDAWAEKFLLRPDRGWLLVQKCRDAGWSQSKHGYVEMWLYHRIGKLLEAL